MNPRLFSTTSHSIRDACLHIYFFYDAVVGLLARSSEKQSKVLRADGVTGLNILRWDGERPGPIKEFVRSWLAYF
jgi:hypothetical protein